MLEVFHRYKGHKAQSARVEFLAMLKIFPVPQSTRYSLQILYRESARIKQLMFFVHPTILRDDFKIYETAKIVNVYPF